MKAGAVDFLEKAYKSGDFTRRCQTRSFRDHQRQTAREEAQSI